MLKVGTVSRAVARLVDVVEDLLKLQERPNRGVVQPAKSDGWRLTHMHRISGAPVRIQELSLRGLGEPSPKKQSRDSSRVGCSPAQTTEKTARVASILVAYALRPLAGFSRSTDLPVV